MDDSLLRLWMQGLEDGLCQIPNEQRAKILACCSKRCADSGVLQEYVRLFHACYDDLDRFFEALNWQYVKGRVIKEHQLYEIIFKGGCMCDLYRQHFITKPWLCDCSKQSIQYVMETLIGHQNFTIKRISSFLEGAKECRFEIEMKESR